MSFPKFLISTLKNSAANQISKKNIENPEFDRQFYKAQFKISITNIKLQFSLIRFWNDQAKKLKNSSEASQNQWQALHHREYMIQ